MRWQNDTLSRLRRAARFGLHAAGALVLAACAVTPTEDPAGPVSVASADALGTATPQSARAERPIRPARQAATPRTDSAGRGGIPPAPDSTPAAAQTPPVSGSWNLFGLDDDDEVKASNNRNPLEGLRADMGTYEERGVASWYGKAFHGRKTANGERFDMGAMTAAHPTLPLDSWVLVRNLRNDKVAVLRINDRGPYHGNRVLDVSYRAAKHLGFVQRGSTQVEIRRLSRTELAALGPLREPGMPDALTDGGGDGISPSDSNGAQPASAKRGGKSVRHVRKVSARRNAR